jgi:REP element-mobilizing transposase RayT
VVRERRGEHHFLFTAWLFLPGYWHAILFPRFPVCISRVMESIKVGSTPRLNASRGESGLLWEPRFFDRALRSVKEYHEKVEYMHLNPVRAGLVRRAEDRRWLSVHDYIGGLSIAVSANDILATDRVLLPTDEGARI